MDKPISNFAFIVLVLVLVIGVVTIIKIDPVLGTDAAEDGKDLTGAAVQDVEENGSKTSWEDLVKNVDPDDKDT